MKTTKTMNTILITIAFFGLQISTIFAGNSFENYNVPEKNKTICIECILLAPHPPLIATYDDHQELASLVNLQTLKPEIPQEASFADSMLAMNVDTDVSLKPEIPSEASFSEQL
jgi:hypothetical protein